MATPSLKRNINRARSAGQEKPQLLPLVTRRFIAWSIEVSLLIASVLVPFGLGLVTQSQFTGKLVPLNPGLTVIAEGIAQLLTLPVGTSNGNVAPLTNFFWTVAVVAPVVLVAWQLYLLAKTGSTLPQRWLGVRVVTSTGKPPGLVRVLLREGVAAWGLPLLFAYLLWFYSSAYPNLGILVGLAALLVVAERISARFHPRRRCLHDCIAGTYVVDANRPIPVGIVNRKRINARSATAPAANTSYVRKTSNDRWQRNWWRWMRQHPNLTVLLVAVISTAAVLGTFVGTEVYIQTQANQRQLQQSNHLQFLALERQLDPKVFASLEERQRAILAMGTLKTPQAIQFLVNLLGQENDYTLVETIGQALVSAGPQALPYLQRQNQYLWQEIDGTYTDNPQPQLQPLRLQQLIETQQAIGKILLIYNGKLHNVDLSHTNLSQINSSLGTYNLVLDKVDLSGIQLQGANLNNASLRGSQFHGAGADGHQGTADDWIANLNDAQMQAVNLDSANLSRVAMEHTNLTRSNLNNANLSQADMTGANLSSTKLVAANLPSAILVNASLTGANIDGAVFSHSNLYAAHLTRASALGAKFESADLTLSDWRGANIAQADFNQANLRNADFSNTTLTGAKFRHAQLENAKFRYADLSMADLRGANVDGADFEAARLQTLESTPAAQFKQTNKSSLTSALVEGVDFSQVKNLNAKQLAYICTQGGQHPRCP